MQKFMSCKKYKHTFSLEVKLGHYGPHLNGFEPSQTSAPMERPLSRRCLASTAAEVCGHAPRHRGDQQGPTGRSARSPPPPKPELFPSIVQRSGFGSEVTQISASFLGEVCG